MPIVRKSKVAGAALSALLVLQGCAGSGGLGQMNAHYTQAAANDSVDTCEAESDAPEECAEHAEIKRELEAARAVPRHIVR